MSETVINLNINGLYQNWYHLRNVSPDILQRSNLDLSDLESDSTSLIVEGSSMIRDIVNSVKTGYS